MMDFHSRNEVEAFRAMGKAHQFPTSPNVDPECIRCGVAPQDGDSVDCIPRPKRRRKPDTPELLTTVSVGELAAALWERDPQLQSFPNGREMAGSDARDIFAEIRRAREALREGGE